MQTLRELETQAIVPFEALQNFRDLGGYPMEGGGVTKRGVFYRAPSLFGLTDADRARMLTLDIRCIVDLRTPGEVEREPGPFGEADGIARYNVSLIDNLHSTSASMNMNLAQLYIYLANEKQEALREVFSIFARHVAEGGCVFHCTAGKDRTGVVAALLLLLCGVSEEDIIHNYAATAILMKRAFEERLSRMLSEGRVVDKALFSSNAENMCAFIRHIKESYGTAAQYLQTIGLTDETIQALRSALAG